MSLAPGDGVHVDDLGHRIRERRGHLVVTDLLVDLDEAERHDAVAEAARIDARHDRLDHAALVEPREPAGRGAAGDRRAAARIPGSAAAATPSAGG